MESMFSEKRLNKYIDNNRFVLYLQPQMSVQSGQITGAQASMRLETRSRELNIQKQSLVRLKKTGLFYLLDLHLLELVCRTLTDWNEQQHIEEVSMKISANTLEREDIVTQIQEIFCKYPCMHFMIRLQVCETEEVKNWKQFYENCHHLQEMGMGFAIDSYGSENTEPDMFRDACFDEIHMDSELTDEMERRTMDYLRVSVMIDMCLDAGKKSVAENVNGEAQYCILKKLGCDYVQGEYAGRPMAARDFENLYFNDARVKSLKPRCACT